MNIRLRNGFIILLVIVIRICEAQEEFTFENPFKNLRVMIFNHSENILQARDEKLFCYSLTSQQNRRIIFNYDSIINICYKQIFKNDFTIAWKIRRQLNAELSKETNIYSFGSTKDACFIFCRIYIVELDTSEGLKLQSFPVVYVLRTDLNYCLKSIFCNTSAYLSGLNGINTTPGSTVCLLSDSNLIMPLSHPHYTSVTPQKNLNTNMTDCMGFFSLRKGKIVLTSTKSIKNVISKSKLLNSFAMVDNIYGAGNEAFAYFSKIPVVYDLKNDNLIPLVSEVSDLNVLISKAEKFEYEVKFCAIEDSILRVIYSVKDSVYLLKYSLNNAKTSTTFLQTGSNEKPIMIHNNYIQFAVISNQNIKIIKRYVKP